MEIILELVSLIAVFFTGTVVGALLVIELLKESEEDE